MVLGYKFRKLEKRVLREELPLPLFLQNKSNESGLDSKTSLVYILTTSILRRSHLNWSNSDLNIQTNAETIL